MLLERLPAVNARPKTLRLVARELAAMAVETFSRWRLTLSDQPISANLREDPRSVSSCCILVLRRAPHARQLDRNNVLSTRDTRHLGYETPFTRIERRDDVAQSMPVDPSRISSPIARLTGSSPSLNSPNQIWKTKSASALLKRFLVSRVDRVVFPDIPNHGGTRSWPGPRLVISRKESLR
jgi:hypothetical protein